VHDIEWINKEQLFVKRRHRPVIHRKAEAVWGAVVTNADGRIDARVISKGERRRFCDLLSRAGRTLWTEAERLGCG
jgi:hypothetical protein